MPFLCALDNLAQARLVADIQRHGPGRGAQARGGLFAFGAIEVGQHHLPAVLHQALGDTEADPPRGAGDERDPRVALMGCVLSRGKSPVSLAAHGWSATRGDVGHAGSVSCASMFMIRRIIVSLFSGSDSATSRVRAARPTSLITGSPAGLMRR